MVKVRQGFLFACGVLLVWGLPAHAVKTAKGKAGTKARGKAKAPPKAKSGGARPGRRS